MKVSYIAMYVGFGRVEFTVLNGKVIDCDPKYPTFLDRKWEDVRKMPNIRDIECLEEI